MYSGTFKIALGSPLVLLTPKSSSAEAFAPYGEVVDIHSADKEFSMFYPLCESPFLILFSTPAETLDTTKLELFISDG